MKSPLTLFASLMMLFGIVTMNSCTKNDIPELGTLKIESKVKYTEDLSQNPFVASRQLYFVLKQVHFQAGWTY